MKKLTSTFIALIAVFLLTNSAVAQRAYDPLEVKRMFIYHFIKYVDWPESSDQEFTITVVGDKAVYEKLNIAFAGTDRTGKTYKVQYAANTASLGNSQLIFLTREASKYAAEVVERYGDLPMLLVTDKNGLGHRGSSINFRETNNTLRFELNMEAIERAGLRVSGQLKNLGILI